MPDISQKLSFNVGGAVRGLTSLTNKLNEANKATKAFNSTTGKNINTVSVDKAKKSVDGLTLSWKTMARIVQTQIALRGINVVTQSLRDGVDQAKKLGLAIEEIQTIMGRTTPSAGLQQQVLDMSDALGSPALGLAEGLYQTLSNQVVKAAESMTFLTQATKLARVTTSDTKSAVNALSSVMNSYGLAASETEHIAGTLFKTVELGRLRLEEIGDIIGRVTPLTAAMGVEWEEAAAAIAVMTRQGVKADTAITQLRAIMTKIIRPTTEMRDIFRSWGVKDGKEAIQAFGGLGGVLKKLSVEVGGSSTAMADLLRRVRTIVGQLSLMNDGGALLAETMGDLKNATEEVGTQWDEFTKSDAFQLEKSVNKFTNSLTRAGTEALPVVVALMKQVNYHLESNVKGWKILLGLWGTGERYQANLKNAVRETQEVIEAGDKEYAKNQKKRFEGTKKSQAQFYLEQRKQEVLVGKLQEDSAERASKAISDRAQNVVELYKTALKELDSFVSTVNAKIKSNTDKLATVNQKIADRKLKYELDNARSSFQKRRILESAYYKQSVKAEKELRRVGASTESKDRAVEANALAIKLAEQAEQQAKGANNVRNAAHWHQVILKLFNDQGKILETNSKYLKKVEPAAKQVSKNMKEDSQRLAELKKQYTKLFDSGDLTSKNKELQKNAIARLHEIEGKMQKIASDASRADKFFKSLGLETNLPKLTDSLSEALDDAHKNWAVEMALAAKAAAATELRFKSDVDQEGIKAQAGKDMGLERLDKEGYISYIKRLDEATIKGSKDHNDVLHDIENSKIRLATRTKELGHVYTKNTEELREQYKILQKGKGLELKYGTTPFSGPLPTRGTVSDPQELATMKLKVLEAKNLQAIIADMNVKQDQGRAITEAEIQSVRERILALYEEKIITDSIKTNFITLLTSLKETVPEAKLLADSLKAKVLTEPSEAMKANTSQILKTRDALKAAEEATKKAEENTKNQGNSIKNVRDVTDKYKVSMDGVGAATGKVNTDVAQMGPNASAQVAGVNSLAEAYRALAAAARAAAAASAGASGGSATVYHGGPMKRYFADGGVAPRGQDRIPASLSRGETVVNSRNSKRFFSELNAMNQGSQPAYREQGGPVTNVGDVNVTVNGGDSSQQTVREIAHSLRRQIKRGTITLR